MDTTTERNLNLLHTAYRALERGDLDACAHLLTEDFVAHLPGAPGPRYGREAWKAGARAMLGGFPDLRITVDDMFGVEGRVAVRVRFRATHLGTFQGVAATGRPVHFSSVELYRVADGRVAEEWVAPDLVTLMRQISPPGDG
ncbi:ester cyclase [Streptomyces sp. LE64]|uniref:ester cyclase n=1 Tax=Streptomyces sp. LE64 TaxID=3448653 RepID=UPI004041FE08